MATTFNLELNTKANKQGFFVVFIRVTQERKKKRVRTSIALRRQSDWNKEKQCVRQSEPNAKAWNMQLERELEAAKAIYRDLNAEGLATTRNIVSRIKDEGAKPTLLAYTKRVRSQMLARGEVGNAKKYGTFEKLLEGYLTHKQIVEDITFKEVTPEFVQGFAAYLNNKENERNGGRLHPNTIAKEMRILRAVVNKAMNIEGYLKVDDNPFKAYKIKEVPIAKDRLEAGDLEAIWALELEPQSGKWHARNAFFFSYYCAGLRAGDMMQLRWGNIVEGRLLYQMGKNHKVKNAILVEPALAILEQYKREGQSLNDYIFPYLNTQAKYARAITQEQKDSMAVELKQQLYEDIWRKNALINKYLREIAKAAGVAKHVSFHVSRHTFAQQAKRAGTDNAMLKGMLNHSSLNVTERYMGEFDTASEDAAMRKIFEPEAQPQQNEAANKEALLAALRSMSKEDLANLINEL